VLDLTVARKSNFLASWNRTEVLPQCYQARRFFLVALIVLQPVGNREAMGDRDRRRASMTIPAWLNGLGLVQYVPVFVENVVGIDLPDRGET
jgi:hypothetical protein